MCLYVCMCFRECAGVFTDLMLAALLTQSLMPSYEVQKDPAR